MCRWDEDSGVLVCGGSLNQRTEKQNKMRRGGDQSSSVCLQKHNSKEKGACLLSSVLFVCVCE